MMMIHWWNLWAVKTRKLRDARTDTHSPLCNGSLTVDYYWPACLAHIFMPGSNLHYPQPGTPVRGRLGPMGRIGTRAGRERENVSPGSSPASRSNLIDGTAYIPPAVNWRRQPCMINVFVLASGMIFLRYLHVVVGFPKHMHASLKEALSLSVCPMSIHQ